MELSLRGEQADDTPVDLGWLRREAARVFDNNRLSRPGPAGLVTYHAPSLAARKPYGAGLPRYLRWAARSLWLARLPWRVSYPHQWSLDSCAHAIVLSHLDTGLAQAEIEALLSAQQPDGFLPHMTWNRRRMHWLDRALVQHVYASGKGSRYLAPPILAEAVEAVYRGSPDPAFLRRVLPGVKRLYSYIAATRVAGDGLAEIISSYESKDCGPEYDPVYGEANTRPSVLGPMFRLMLRHRLLGWDTARILSSQRFRVKDLWFNVSYARSLWALGRLCQAAGEAEEAEDFQRQAAGVEAAILGRMYDEETGLFFSLDSRWGRDRPLPAVTISSLLPLALATIDLARLDRLIDDHLLNPLEFWAPYPAPVQPLSAAPGSAARYRIWRGPQVWVIINWQLARGLRLQAQRFPQRRQRYIQIADALTLKTYQLVRRNGFREFYDARSGQGHRARDLGWSTLVLDMAASVSTHIRMLPKRLD